MNLSLKHGTLLSPWFEPNSNENTWTWFHDHVCWFYRSKWLWFSCRPRYSVCVHMGSQCVACLKYNHTWTLGRQSAVRGLQLPHGLLLWFVCICMRVRVRPGALWVRDFSQASSPCRSLFCLAPMSKVACAWCWCRDLRSAESCMPRVRSHTL